MYIVAFKFSLRRCKPKLIVNSIPLLQEKLTWAGPIECERSARDLRHGRKWRVERENWCPTHCNECLQSTYNESFDSAPVLCLGRQHNVPPHQECPQIDIRGLGIRFDEGHVRCPQSTIPGKRSAVMSAIDHPPSQPAWGWITLHLTR